MTQKMNVCANSIIVKGKNNMHEQIIRFINEFSKFGPEVVDCFTNGNCYWFAHILYNRFFRDNYEGDICYDQVENHFCYYSKGHYYDITGEITDPKYHWESFARVARNDPALAKRLERDCILKESRD